MVADGVCVKGVILLARLKHLRESYGEVTLCAVLDRMLPSDRELLRGMLLVPSLWYPVALLGRLDQAIDAHFAPGMQRGLFRQIGRVLANLDCEARAPLLRRGDPHHALRASSALYGQHYRYGVRTYAALDAHSCLLTSTGPDAIAVADCLTARGWLERMLELAGALDAEVDERWCRLQGAAACEHLCRWKVAGVAFTGLAAGP